MEIGSIICFAGSTLPEGFLVCDGSAVSRETYSDLFSVIGTTYGTGDGSTTFNLPSLGDRVAMGKSSTHNIGTSGGESTHTLTAKEMPSHSHTVPEHGHGNTLAFKTPSLSHSITTQPSFTYTKLSSTSNIGRNNAGDNRYTGTTSESMTRSTSVGITNHAATACTMGGSVTDCNALTSDSKGSGSAHNNMMPFMSLKFLIRYEPDTPPVPRIAVFNGAIVVSPLGGYISGKTR